MREESRLTPGEFELMDILWSLGKSSVKEVWQELSQKRPIAYTTVMTVLDKLHRKGALKQTKKGKAYFYIPILSRDEVLRQVVDNIIHVYFGGSEESFHDFLHHPRTGGSMRPHTPQEAPTPASEEADGPSLEEFLL